MLAELSLWNNGDGIDIDGWISGMGTYQLAVGYLTLFWPEFVEFDGYILRKDFAMESLRGFESSPQATRKGTEW